MKVLHKNWILGILENRTYYNLRGAYVVEDSAPIFLWLSYHLCLLFVLGSLSRLMSFQKQIS